MLKIIGTPTQKPKETKVRVFISSTFHDMQEERNYLTKYIFPELRSRCGQLQLDFVDIDLRWGVTEEQAERGQVIPICFKEIDNCRPYFIGILGNRYGHIPKQIPYELTQIETWLLSQNDKSITELEFLYGALNNPSAANRAFFYFRDSDNDEQISDEKQSDLNLESQEHLVKLADLKKRIRLSGLSLNEGYNTPKKLGQLVLKDMWHAIEEDFPEENEVDPLDKQSMDHEAFAKSRTQIIVEKPSYFEAINDFVARSNTPLVLTGDSGIGKSTLLAGWVERYRQIHPETFVLLHFIGSSQRSTDYVEIIRRVLGEIKRRCVITDDIPIKIDQMKAVLSDWLAQASATGQMVWILDGLNHLEDCDNALDLGWLPEYFPPNIQLIVSTLPGRTLDAMNKRSCSLIHVKGLERDEREQMIIRFLSRYGKSVNHEQMELILGVPQTANPLYLRTLLDELRVFGVYQELDNRLSYYLKATTISSLYKRVFERLEQDYEKERTGLVGEFLSLIWASRSGLYESELLELLGSAEDPLPRAIWSPLYLAMTESLIDRSGYLDLCNDHLKDAVFKHYVRDEEISLTIHLRIADYFSSIKRNKRKAEELPWQLKEAKEWERLKICLMDLDIFMALSSEQAKSYELQRYWMALADKYDSLEAYDDSLKKFEQSLPFSFEDLKFRGIAGLPLLRYHTFALTMQAIASFYMDNAYYKEAQQLFERSLWMMKKLYGNDNEYTLDVAQSLGKLMYEQGDYIDAKRYFDQVILIQSLFKPLTMDIAKNLNNLAETLREMGHYNDALEMHQKILGIKKNLLGTEHASIATSLNNIAMVLLLKGNFKEAESMFRNSIKIAEKMLGSQHPSLATYINNLAGSLRMKGENQKAKTLFQRALKIREKLLGPKHPKTAESLNNLSEVLHHEGDLEGAEKLLTRSISIYEKIFGSKHPETAVGFSNLAELLSTKGDLEKAKEFSLRALRILEKERPEQIETAQCLNTLASILFFQHDYDNAEQIFRRSLVINEKSSGIEHPETVKIMNNLAKTLYLKRDYIEAESLYRRALEIANKTARSDHPYAQKISENLSLLLRERQKK